MSNVQLGYTQIIDPISFKSIPSGKIYIGEYGTLPNPASAGTWKQAYFVNSDGTRTAASQPIRTNAAGYAVDGSGNIKTVQVDAGYSLLVQDQFNATKFTQEKAQEVGSPDGSNMVGFKQFGTGSVVTTLQDKLYEIVSAGDFGATRSGSAASNKVALQLAIAAIDAAGGGMLEVPLGIDYGFKNTDPTTYPDFTGCNNDITVVDYGIGDADGSGNKAGAQIRTFYYTKQTVPAGQHDGNGSWIYGAWHPYYSVNNTAQLEAAGHPSRTASDNRRASLLFNNDGESTWRLGQGTLAGAAYTDEEMSNFVLEHYQATGDTLPNYAPLTIERKTGNWSIGGGTNAPQAMLSVKNVTSGYWTALFESLSTTVETRLRNSNGSSDDVAILNVSGNLALNIPSQGNALTVDKTNRNIGIGVTTATQRLTVANSVSTGFVTNFKNTNATNGSVAISDSSSAPGVGWSHYRAFASNQTNEQFNLRGDGNAFCDGAWTGGGADYAEYFEWDDGNQNGEDRRGMTVALVGHKVKPAADGDRVIGVVSANPSVVGDAAWNHWSGKYQRDEYGMVITEPYEIVEWEDKILTREGKDADADGYEVFTHSYAADGVPEDTDVPVDAKRYTAQRPVLNPDYDAAADYIPREHRKEWACIGLVGKLRVRYGQPVDERWIKMRDISDSVSEYLVR